MDFGTKGIEPAAGQADPIHRRSQRPRHRVLLTTLSLGAMLTACHAHAQSCISLTATTYSQNFNSLANTGSAADTTLPAGWYLLEGGTGANSNYSAGTGSSSAGDTYSFGLAGSNERSLGSVRSGAVVPSFGACVTNNTGGPISAVRIEYIGRQWRLGTAGRTDALVFNTSTDATSLASGTWSPTPASLLDFVTPTTTVVGAKDGTFSGNYRFFGETLPLQLPAGATAWIRWTDTDASGADDGLAVDNFSIVPDYGPVTPVLSIDDVTLAEGSTGPTSFLFRLSLTAPAPVGGVSYDITTANGTAVAGDDYTAVSIVTARIGQGSTSGIFSVQVDGDTTPEADETFFVNISNVAGATLADGQGKGTILDDDSSLVPVHAIQGNGAISPLGVGTVVTTQGIVTARTSNGFFLQASDAEADMDASTSEGVFVFTGAAPPASAAVRNRVRVTATIDEYNPGGQLPLTELKNATISELSAGNALPVPIEITVADANANSTVDRLERYEGMRVSVASLKVVAPVDGSINEVNATSTSNGIFYGVLPGVARPMREPGIDVLDAVVIPAGKTPPVFDHNPELLRVRSGGQTGAPVLSVDVGDSVNNLVGVLDYGFASYTITPDPSPAATVAFGAQVTAVNARRDNEMTIGGFNLLHFFDDINDGDGATTLTADAYVNRLFKARRAICDYTRAPDILGVVEVEHIKALGDLATVINGGCGGSPLGGVRYVPYLVEGNDVGGIDVGFLVNTFDVAPDTPRIEVISVDQVGKATPFANPDGSTETLNDRPPLVLVARVNAPNGASKEITVIANHLRSLIDVNSMAPGTRGWPTAGERVRAKRAAQAMFLAQLVQDRQTANPGEKIVLLGDFNAFEFNDGLVDSMGIITGREAGPTDVLHYADSPITTPLTNTASLVPPAERYSFSFDGNAQSLDHMVVNQAVLDDFISVRTEHARINADFGVDNFGDAVLPLRVSDHDPVVLFLGETSFNTANLGIDVSAPAEYSPVQGLSFFVTLGSSGPDAATGVKLDMSSNLPPDVVSLPPREGWTCSQPEADGAGGSLVHCARTVPDASISTQFEVVVDVNAPGANVPSATLGAAVVSVETDPDPSNNSASATSVRTDFNVCFVVNGQCTYQNPAIDQVAASGVFHGTLAYANLGGATPEDTYLYVFLPFAADVVQIPAGNENCNVMFGASPNTSTVICLLGQVPGGNPAGTVSFDIVDMSFNMARYFEYSARLSVGQSFSVNYRAKVEFLRSADFGISLAAYGKPGDYRNEVEFRGVARNEGPDKQSSVLHLRYTAPGATALPVPEGGDWSCNFVEDSIPVAGEVICSIYQFAPGDAHDAKLTFHPAFGQTGQSIRIEAEIEHAFFIPSGSETPESTDPPANNTATATYAVPTVRFAPPTPPPPARVD